MAASRAANADTADLPEYDWDEISVGVWDEIGGEGNCSQRFFGRTHPEHEQYRNRLDIDKDAENDFNLNNLVELLAVQEVKSETEHIKQEATEDDGRRQRQERVKQNVGTVTAAQENLREFNVIKYDQMYKTKQMQRIALEEKRRKELCSFQSKPAPNFQAIHAANGQKRNKEQIPFTVPATPKVVQRHREAVERIRKKQAEITTAQMAKPFKPNTDPEVLRSKPFVPRATTKPATAPVPFKLHSDERSKERRQYDEENRLELERKRKEEEELRQRAEEYARREIRKGTTFKARPNPFANH